MKYDDCNEGIMQFLFNKETVLWRIPTAIEMIRSRRKGKEKWTVMIINKVHEAVKI